MVWLDEHGVSSSDVCTQPYPTAKLKVVCKWPRRARSFLRRQQSCSVVCRSAWSVRVEWMVVGEVAVLLDLILQYHKRKIGASLIRKVVRCIWSDEAHGSEYLKKCMYRSWPCPYIKQPCIHLVAVPVVALTSFSQQWIQLVSESHCRLFMSHGNTDIWPDDLLHVVEVMEVLR